MRPIFTAARWIHTALLAATVAGLVCFISLVGWARQLVPADPLARFALDSDETVTVTREKWISFRPRDSDPVTGLIFYPGGKTDPAAYAPVLHVLAARGFLVVLCPMPLNLALLAPDRAMEVIPRYPEIQHWVVGGHSLGGVVAAEFAERHAREIDGLLLWASYPAAFTNLGNGDLPALAVYGTADTLTTPEEIRESADRFPYGTIFLPVTDADHWGFGNFDPRLSPESLPRDALQAILLDTAQEFLEAIAPAGDAPDIQ